MHFLVFIFILSILVLVHEWGHYITARKCGVRVEQFSLGFGRKLWSRRRGDTEFLICAIPLGGYVKMAGDDRQHAKGSPDEFYSKSVGQRALIVLMGPVINVVLAFVCFWLVFMIGYVDMELSAQKIPAVIGEVRKASPAEKAGLMAGDKVISINGRKVAHWPDLQDSVRESSGSHLTVVLTRGEETMTKMVTPAQESQKDIFGREHPVRLIGVGQVPLKSSEDVVIVRYGPIKAFGRAFQELLDVTQKTYRALYEMCIGLRSPKEVMGLVGMFQVIKFAMTISLSFVLHIVGVISASLAIFNLLPLIPLDGGHLLLLGIEKIRGRALSAKLDHWITRVGFSLILMLAVFVFYVDFERIGLIDKVTHFLKPG